MALHRTQCNYYQRFEFNKAANYACVRGPYLGSILYQVDQVGALLDGDTPLALRGTRDLIAGAKAGQQGEEESVSKHIFFSQNRNFFETCGFILSQRVPLPPTFLTRVP
jgi:hypothetical protein